MRRALTILLAAGALVFGALFIAVPLIAQDQPSNAQQKSFFVNFVQDRLSTPERQISISNIDGALSSNASINQITVSDTKGVWLKINKAAIDWNQGALLTGRLEINKLKADSIEVLRNPVPAKGQVNVPAPEAGGLQIPQLPVAVIIKEFSIPKVSFGEQVFGLGSEISVDGGVTLEGGSLDAKLAVKRLDGPGGQLDLKVKYDHASTNIDLGLSASEPPDGIIANLLQIEGKPEVKLALNGSGPVSALKGQLSLDAGGTRALTGTATVSQADTGFVIATDLHGPIATLVAPAYRPFFGAETALTASGTLRKAGGITLKSLKLTGGQLSLTASGSTSTDGFLDALSLHGQIAAGGDKVVLPVAGQDTKISTAKLDVDYGGVGSDKWTGKLTVAGFENGVLGAQTATISASGIAANLDQPDKRRVTFNGDGAVAGVTANNPDVQDALGDKLGFGIAGLWNAGQPIQLAQLRLVGKALMVELQGQIDKSVFDGDIAVKTTSLSPFSGIAGRDLGGALDLNAKGTISPLIGGFSLMVNGTGTNLSTGEGAVDRVLGGEVTLSGGLARTTAGFEANQFTIANKQVKFSADGNFATGAADFRFDLGLADLGLVTPEASGALKVTGTAKGTDGTIGLALKAMVADGTLAGRPLRGGQIGIHGNLIKGSFAGNLDGAATLSGQPVSLTSTLSLADGARRLGGLEFTAGGTRLTGKLTQRKDGLFEGQFKLGASDISTAAALALVEARGAANADIALSVENGKQSATIAGRISKLEAAGVKVNAADIKARVADLFGVPQVVGTFSGSGIVAAGITAKMVSATAKQQGNATSFNASAALTNGTALTASGALAPLGGGYKLSLDNLTLAQRGVSAKLAAPAALSVNGDSVTLDNVRFDVGSGTLNVAGSAGKALDIVVGIKNLPLSIANAIAPDLRLSGALNGTVKVTGSGAAPKASFDVAGSGLGAAAIANYGIAPLSLSAKGSFADNTVRLASVTANGQGGLKVSGSGSVPLSGRGLMVSLKGGAPLSLANRFVADRGGQASGTVSLDAQVTGSLSAPKFGGNISTRGAQYVDPALNLKLVNITGNARLTGDRVTIGKLTAGLATGGSADVSGSVSLTQAGFPADITVGLNHARYADGDLVVATASGSLKLTGPLLGNGLITGRINVEKADITVPERLGGGATAVNVKHIDLPPQVAKTLARAKVDATGRPPVSSVTSPLRLNIRVSAPNQIFVRGRGLDAELGGSVQLGGNVSNIQPVGAFNLIRGRLSILGQRIDFNSGSITLTGNLDPMVNLIGNVQGEGITVTVSVSGRVSDIKVDFTSTPALPQDEVLSQLIFKRALGDLSPLQLARLASAASELAGGGGSSLIDSLRQATGLDDLGIITDSSGNTAVTAGRYISNNVYLGVQAGANGDSKVTIDLNVTKDIKARAATGANGDSSLGLFYEKDY